MAATLTAESQTLTFEPPGPGVWERADMHHPRPVPRDWVAMEHEGAKAGFQPWAQRYGLLLDYFDTAAVNGFLYYRFRGVGESEKGSSGSPPKLVLKLALALHPELRRRRRNAERTLAERTWMADAERWHNQVKPAAIATNRRLQSVDIDALDDAALVAHLRRCRAHVVDMMRVHQENNGPVLPTGLLLNAVQEWTGRGDDVPALLQGASQVSSGRGPELSRLAEAIRADEVTYGIVIGDATPQDVIAHLSAHPGEVGEAYRRYVDMFGYRLVGDALDIGNPYLLEAPELLVGAIRTEVETDPSTKDDSGIAQLQADVRARVPAEHRDEFDRLLDEARATYSVRDERSVYTNVWSGGIYRHALIKAGERLVARGVIEEAVHLVDATIDEVAALFGEGTDAPTGEELAARAGFRAQHATTAAPRYLGGEPADPPPLEWLPDALRRVNAAVMVQVEDTAADDEPQTGELRGLAASRGSYTGTARVVSDTADFARLQQGDVLVARTTSEAFNVVLPLLGAIVTDRGGVLSHAAIVSREAGIPAVVGTGSATSHIPDGATVHVDGTTGEVRVVS